MSASLAAKSLIAGVRSKIAPPGSFAACSDALAERDCIAELARRQPRQVPPEDMA